MNVRDVEEAEERRCRMKNPRKPTRAQKIIMEESGLDSTVYLVISEEKEKLKVISKIDNEQREIAKKEEPERRSRRWK